MINSFQGEYRFLSNFAPILIRYGDRVYPSVENAYQAAKTLDLEQRKQFSYLNPGAAKRRGRELPIRPDWTQVKLEVMYQLVKEKFTNKKYMILLLSTGSEELVEGNQWGDTFWGVCRGKGENNLGKILMRVRKEIKDNA